MLWLIKWLFTMFSMKNLMKQLICIHTPFKLQYNNISFYYIEIYHKRENSKYEFFL